MTRAVEVDQSVYTPRPVGLARLLGFLLLPAAALTGGFNGIQQILVPGQVGMMDPAGKVSTLALLTTFAAISSMIGIPIGGALSDRTRSRFGRRAPWIAGLSLISAVLMIGMGLSTNLLLLGTVYALLWLSANMHQGALSAILPDRIPEQRRGLASAVIGLAVPIGALVGVNLASRVGLLWGYGCLGLLLVVASFALVLGAPEAPSLDLPLPAGLSGKKRRDFSGFFEAFRHRDFTLAFVSRFLLFLAYATTNGYLYYTLSDYIGTKNIPGGNVPVAVSTLLTTSVAIWVLVATFCGWLADRVDRRKLFVGISAAGLGVSMIVPILSPTWTGMLVYCALSGAFIGTYFAVDLAVMTLVLPSKEQAGRDLGILQVATGLPQIMSSLVAGAIITHAGGYTSLYLFGGLCAFLAGITIFFIKKVR